MPRVCACAARHAGHLPHAHLRCCETPKAVSELRHERAAAPVGRDVNRRLRCLSAAQPFDFGHSGGAGLFLDEPPGQRIVRAAQRQHFAPRRRDRSGTTQRLGIS